MLTHDLTGRMRPWIVGFVMLALLAASLVVSAPAARAADASDFDPGFLISDANFFHGTALTASQVTSFIDGKNAGCLTGRTCIENYRESVTAKSANSRCDAIPAKSNQNAGQIIATVAAACGISPKAIIVILQKEQSLITARSPGARAFEASMGAGCPDTAPCDATYAGFYANVYYGAYLLKGYTIPGSTHYNRYAAGKTSSIAYSPRSYGTNPTCGFKSVFVKNQATHALYVYTPYTPNAAALANLYGTGNSCSAYGNRNFWRLWTDWFGSTGSVGTSAIETAYIMQGGASGPLGAATSTITAESANGGGMYQRFQNGWILWTKSAGAQIVPADLMPFYRDAGGPSGTYGWPTTKATTTTAGGGGTRQDFQGGILMRSTAAGAVIPVTGGFATGLDSYGGVANGLGWPLAPRTRDAGTGMAAQRFQNGLMLHSGTWHVAIATEFEQFWRDRGDFDGPYGKPTSRPFITDASGGGVRQNFEGGVLMHSAASGKVVTITGGFISAMDAYGGVANGLGWPVTARSKDPATGLFVQQYQRGTILHDGRKHAAVANEFLDAYLASGGFTGSWGFPKSKPYYSTTGGGGVRQNFSIGSLFSSSAAPGTVAVTGGFVTALDAYGGVNGGVGWPTEGRTRDAVTGFYSQSFQHGVIVHTGSKHQFIATEFLAHYASQGGPSGSLGWATGAPVRSSSGVYEHFTGGSLFLPQGSSTVLTVSGAFRDAFHAYGGVSGIGWPLANRTRDAQTDLYLQSFQRGSILSDGTRTQFVAKELLASYLASDGPYGAMGWPTSMPQVSDSGVSQSFEHGVLVWTSADGVKSIAGELASTWRAAGGLDGSYGVPTSVAYVSSASGGGVRQNFAGGTLMYSNAAGGTVAVLGGFIEAMDSYGGVASGLGWPLAARTSKDPGTGYYTQRFQNGTIVHTGSAHTYVANAFAASVLNTTLCGGGIGWTTSLPSTSAGTTTQSFDHATLTWASATGVVVSCSG